MEILITCFFIFIVRLIDTTLGTFRTILIIKNKKNLAVFIAFIEILIWFLVVKKAITSEYSFYVALSYATGFSIGTYIGMRLTGIFLKTKVNLLVVIDKKNKELLNKLTNNGYAFSAVDAQGKDLKNDKLMLFICTQTNNLNDVRKIILANEKDAFIIATESIGTWNGFYNN